MNADDRSAWLPGNSEMAALVRAHEWSDTPLGPIERWPQSLRTALGLMLSSRHPIFMGWGPSLIALFDDAYRPILGARLVGALGRPFAELWADVWSDVEPLVATVLAGGATWVEDQPLVMTRNGFEEMTYFTFSHSPLWDDAGGVGGLLNVCSETTGKVIQTLAQPAHDQVQLDHGRLHMDVVQVHPARRATLAVGHHEEGPRTLGAH